MNMNILKIKSANYNPSHPSITYTIYAQQTIQSTEYEYILIKRVRLIHFRNIKLNVH